MKRDGGGGGQPIPICAPIMDSVGRCYLVLFKRNRNDNVILKTRCPDY